MELADKLKLMAPPGMTLSQMANRWCLDFDAVTTIIPGAKNPEQAVENPKASDLPPLSKELHQKMNDFYQKEVASHPGRLIDPGRLLKNQSCPEFWNIWDCILKMDGVG